MKKQSMPTGFSGFAWGLGVFCMPVLLCPMAMLLSPALSKNPHLTDLELKLFATFLWAYPVILAVVARWLYKLSQRNHRLAVKCLWASFVIFYVTVFYVCKTGFGG